MNTFTTRTGTILPPRKARPDVLRGGAAVIREDGLTKGIFARADVHGQRTTHCTVGALMAAVGDNQMDIRSVQPEIDLLTQMLGCPPLPNTSPVVGIYSWNDAARRTADDVITLLEQAAEKAEADR